MSGCREALGRCRVSVCSPTIALSNMMWWHGTLGLEKGALKLVALAATVVPCDWVCSSWGVGRMLQAYAFASVNLLVHYH